MRSLRLALAPLVLVVSCASPTVSDPDAEDGRPDRGVARDLGVSQDGGERADAGLRDGDVTSDTGLSAGDTGLSAGDTGLSAGDTGLSAGDTGISGDGAEAVEDAGDDEDGATGDAAVLGDSGGAADGGAQDIKLIAHVGRCFNLPGVTRVEAYVLEGGVDVARSELTPAAPDQVFTFTARGSYVLGVDAFDSGGTLLREARLDASDLQLAEELHLYGCPPYGTLGCYSLDEGWFARGEPGCAVSWTDPVVARNGRGFYEKWRETRTIARGGSARVSERGICLIAECRVPTATVAGGAITYFQAVIERDALQTPLPTSFTWTSSITFVSMPGGGYTGGVMHAEIEAYDLDGNELGRGYRAMDHFGYSNTPMTAGWPALEESATVVPFDLSQIDGVSLILQAWCRVQPGGSSRGRAQVELGHGACTP